MRLQAAPVLKHCLKKTVNLNSGSRVDELPLVFPAATLHAVRRWWGADESPLHERTTAGKVGESLEPGGALCGVKSEVACATAWLREARTQSGPMFLNTVRAAFA
jgi:hypothetical protein